MKKLIVNKMGLEAKALWELSRKSRLTGPFAELLRDHVQEIKGEYANYEIDSLTDKAKKFRKPGSWGKFQIEQLPSMVYDINKKPWEVYKGEWVSVEVELIMRSPEVCDRFAAFCKEKGWSRYVTIKDDGSLRLGSESECSCGAGGSRDHREGCGRNSVCKELVITFRYGHWEMITELCAFLNRNRCGVNRSCGLHVHFDCRHLNADEVTKVGGKVALTIPALKTMLPRSRQDNDYCREYINTMSERGGDRTSRYAFVNLQAYNRHKTIEFRGHSGTTDSRKIINWIKILRTIMDSPKVNEEIYSVVDMASAIPFDDEIKNYMNERAAKFASQRRVSGDDIYEDNANTQAMAVNEAPEQSVSGVDAILRQLANMLTEANDLTRQAEQAQVAVQAAPAVPMRTFTIDVENSGLSDGIRYSLGSPISTEWVSAIESEDEEDDDGIEDYSDEEFDDEESA